MMSCKVIRIGVFFDGTGNNLTNDEAGRSSNGVSNIGKLYRLYADNEILRGKTPTECLIYIKAIYIEGVGTINNEDDYATGGGAGTLGAQRINQAIEQLSEIRDQFPKSEYKCYIDVFGFSRGAAMARDFINEMYRKHRRLTFTFKFVGLFDTVGSFGLAGNNINYKPITNEDTETDTIKYETSGATFPSRYYEPYNFNLSPRSAEKIVHFIALDEYRKNFPLSDTQGAGLSYYFIGAHSDIGGGYANVEYESLFDYALGNNLIQAEKKLGKPEDGIQFGKDWQCKVDENVYGNSSPYNNFRILCRGSREVTDDLQKVTLVAMYNLAIMENVPFINDIPQNYQDVPFSPDDTSILLKWTKELREYYEIATTNISSLKLLIGGQTAFNNQSELHIRTFFHRSILAKYAHNSSISSFADKTSLRPIGFKHLASSGVTDTIANGARRIRNNPLPIREAYANDIGKAVVIND